MANAGKTEGLSAFEGSERDLLVLSCLKVRRLAFDLVSCHPDFPETPQFVFYRSESLESLREYFRSGPHRFREGIIYLDIAFAQQVNMGDEWLVLKREFDDEAGESYWIPFESYSFERILKSSERFSWAIEALVEADPYDIAALFGGSPRQRQMRRDS